MKKVIVSIAVLLASSVCILAADKAPKKETKDTPRVKQAAAKAFAEGKKYYIWLLVEPPVKPATSNFVGPQYWSIPFGYLAKEREPGVPFRGVLVLPYKDPKSGVSGEYKRGIKFEGSESNPSGEVRASLVFTEGKTEGKGDAKLYLIKEPGTPADQNDGDPISNTLAFPVLAPAPPAKKP